MSYEKFKKDVDELFRELNGFLPNPANFVEASDAFDKCQMQLDVWLSGQNDLHAQIPEYITQQTSLIWYSQEVCNSLIGLATRFFNSGTPVLATALLTNCWNKLALKQFESGHRIYRASIALMLAQFKYILGDMGATAWWAIHTQADDHLGGHKTGGAGRQMLKAAFGVSDPLLDSLADIGITNLESTAKSKNGWKYPTAFAEDVVLRFVLENRSLSYIFSNNSTTLEYPISPAYFQILLKHIDLQQPTPRQDQKSEKSKANNLEKGNALEKLAAYLFLLIPGWLPLRNTLIEKQTTEIDVVVRNVYPTGNLMADIFGRHFIVECKNWRTPVGSRDVGYFLNKIRQSHASFGIIFSRKGIKGAGHEERAAKELTRRAFHEDKSICIVISHSHLEQLKEGKITFRALLLELYEEFRFGRTKFEASQISLAGTKSP